MNRPIRQLTAFMCVMFLVLAGASTYIQFFSSRSLNANPWNVRTLYHQQGTERGPIIVGGEAIAKSVPTDDKFAFGRTYADSMVYSNITGYFSVAHNASTGIERSMDTVLSGLDSSLAWQRIADMFTGSQPRGGGVELTIDPVIQKAAYNALGDQRGAVVVLKSSTGEIAAQVSTPGFDANAIATHDTPAARGNYTLLSKNPNKPLVDRATGGDQYAPGSTFKLLTTAAMIEYSGMKPDTMVEAPLNYSPPGTTHQIWNPGRDKCGDGSGHVTLTKAFEESCNTPFAIAGVNIGADKMVALAEKFGFNKPLSTPLNVSASRFPKPQDKASLAMDSIGQRDVRVTPLQMAMIGAAIYNDGIVMSPTIIKQIVNVDLEPIQTFSPQEIGRAISSQTAQYMHQMMVDEVKAGTGTRAAVKELEVAGKTGTGEINSTTPPHAWFVGNTTIGGEKYTAVAIVENSGHAGWRGDGGSVAAPIVRKIFEAKLATISNGRER